MCGNIATDCGAPRAPRASLDFSNDSSVGNPSPSRMARGLRYPSLRKQPGGRVERQRRLDAGERPDFLPETRSVREAAWTVAPIPADLADRRVEITGPVDRKMIINALNSGARVYMADFEDSNAPTWRNNLEGQLN